MLRLCVDHEQRQVTDLSGLWDFAIIPDWNTLPTAYGERMLVPDCYDAMPDHAGYRGAVAYRTFVQTDGSPHRLVFDAISHRARILWDGEVVGEHAGGYTRFHVDLPSGRPGRHELVVLVDNRFDPEASPLHHAYFDWYQYGGIIRPVALHRLPPVWIEQVTVRVLDWHLGRLSVVVDWARRSADDGQIELSIQVDGQNVAFLPVRLEGKRGRVAVEVMVPQPRPWTPASPHLHTVKVRLGEDDQIERIGLRTVRVSGREILLNDEPIHLRGVNRHEAHPEFGQAIPLDVMLADIQLIKALHGNFVRGSHYPQDVRFLDLCDEFGILVWQEATAWQARVEHLTDPAFIAAQLRCIDEMVAASANHPSVIIWGILNESASETPETRPAYERLLGRLRELDPTRPVTYASHRQLGDLHMDLVDIVSLNIYPGWYFGTLDTMTDWMNALMAGVREKGWDQKPLIFSEFGAGAIYGWHDQMNGKWSEPYQARLLDIALRWMWAQPEVAGTAIWQYCDCRVSPERAVMRPREFNNKGLVDEYRRPKQAFEVVKAIYGEVAKR